MATSVSLGTPLWTDGMTFNGQLGRQSDVGTSFVNSGNNSAVQTMSGVVQGPSTFAVFAASGMNITVSAGFAIVANSSSALQGAYQVANMAAQTLTVATSDPLSARVDLVVVNVYDDGISPAAVVELVTGTPGAGVPTVPANSVVLAQINVGAAVSSINSGNIADQRTYTASSGGIVPWTNTAGAIGGVNGTLAYDASIGRFFHNSTTGPLQMKTKPWAPITVTRSTPVSSSGTETTVLSSNVTVDGHTNLDIMLSYPGTYMNTIVTGCIMLTQLYIDSSLVFVMEHAAQTAGNAGHPVNGGTLRYITDSVLGTTPSAGTHTIKWTVKTFYNGTTASFLGHPTNTPIVMRIEPTSL
jgi:hypothetical protein